MSVSPVDKHSTIGNHKKDELGKDPKIIGSNFKILKNVRVNLTVSFFIFFFIPKLEPKLNKQSDSIRAKLFY